MIGFAGEAALRLRPVEAADEAAVQALIGGIYASYGIALDLEGEDRHLLAPGATLRGQGGEFWVVEGPEGIVATVAARPAGEGAAELKAMYVAPAWRRRGLGGALEEVVASWARSAGRPRLVLWSDVKFEGAHAMYRRLGYAQAGERELHDLNATREYGFWRVLAVG